MPKVSFFPEDADASVYRLEVSMTLGQWKMICDDLDAGSKRSASYDLREAIRAMTRMAEANFGKLIKGPENE